MKATERKYHKTTNARANHHRSSSIRASALNVPSTARSDQATARAVERSVRSNKKGARQAATAMCATEVRVKAIHATTATARTVSAMASRVASPAAVDSGVE